jgi:divalent metal cation (Fe/Co/Zn/Cd) transporter
MSVAGEVETNVVLPESSDGEFSTVGATPLSLQAVRTLERKLSERSQLTSKKHEKTCLTPNIKALMVSAFLFSLITIIQIFAAKIAHSQALLMDCISMGVDALTYMGNIVVELRKRDGSDHKGTQLIACAISLSCLLYFTFDAMQESWGTVRVCQGWDSDEGDEDDVNGYITLGFALGGVVFDALCLWAFYESNKKNGEARHVNMFTALLHVSADCLRSTSTTVMSILILWGGVDSSCADAYTSILIGVTIIGGGCVGVFNWGKLLWAFCLQRFQQKSTASKPEKVEA